MRSIWDVIDAVATSLLQREIIGPKVDTDLAEEMEVRCPEVLQIVGLIGEKVGVCERVFKVESLQKLRVGVLLE